MRFVVGCGQLTSPRSTAHAVHEYWIVDPEDASIEQHVLEGRGFRLAAKQQNGTIRCQVVAGFSLPVRAAFDDEENLGALRAIKPGG